MENIKHTRKKDYRKSYPDFTTQIHNFPINVKLLLYQIPTVFAIDKGRL